MNASLHPAPRLRRLVWAAVAGGLLVFVGANAHLAYVAFTSQPDCVPHSKGADGNHDYRAAKSAC
ncbi:hypothetical protein ACFFTN_12590 [Aminobacter aganoensis]|uniref:Uncharacterized protein n=1 Tax=Aminobacter aganoensis TaxID=83264 RepID=A0A7X0F9Y3_9HYPH|nr:hypothetical protein [Aminobacter aganoensis]MBB6355854.1 hypothetical protein [Aminobacter aganoensis]